MSNSRFKFRVFDNKKKEYLVYKKIYFFEYGEMWMYSSVDDCVFSELQYCIESDDFAVEQFTGLHDREGKEIYFDGDRVRFKFMTELHKHVELVGTLEFNIDEQRTEINIEENEHGYICLSFQGNGIMYDFEVIGTIHSRASNET